VQEQIAIVVPEVDCFVDCVGRSQRTVRRWKEKPAVLNQAMAITESWWSIGIPGLYVTEDPGATDEASKQGSLKIRFGLGWEIPSFTQDKHQ
jgi:glutathione-independent formaldehyde dehydrogenase